MTRKWALRAGLLCWLTLVWVMLWGTLTPANVLSGLVVATLITVLLPLPVMPMQGRLHPLSLIRLLLYVAWDLTKASFQIAWLTVRPGGPPKGAILRAEMAVKSDLTLSLAAAILTLIPGTMVVDLDQAGRVLYVHVLNVEPEGAIERFHRDIAYLRKLLIAAFERDEEWRPATEGAQQ